MNTDHIIQTLERLEKNTALVRQIIKTTGSVETADKMAGFKYDHETPRTFQVGDFIIMDRQWTKCDCSGTLPPS